MILRSEEPLVEAIHNEPSESGRMIYRRVAEDALFFIRGKLDPIKTNQSCPGSDP